MGRMSKQKGAAFERWVCQQLSLWVSHGKRRDLFWRSAMSGGRATLGARKGQKHRTQCGDISAISPEGAALTTVFMVECKCYRSLDLHKMVYGKGRLVKMWRALMEESAKFNRDPMLIFKENGRPPMVVVDDDSWLLEGLGGVVVNDEHMSLAPLAAMTSLDSGLWFGDVRVRMRLKD